MPVCDDKEEARQLIRAWVALQREKYGENWKEVLAKEMAEKSAPMISLLLALQRK